jgi:acetolactate synthase-1/2/3 large subunit
MELISKRRVQTMELTCGEVLAKSLKKEGVKFVFGVPGGQLFPFTEAVSREDGMEVITTRHEENAAHMADAVSRLTGTIGVCFGTTGPGATNMLPGVAAAYADSIPLLAITPNNQTFCTYPFIGSLQNRQPGHQFQGPNIYHEHVKERGL